ncbi:MAG: hypothetical protein JO165_07090 [Candidatus Eremiobacteraeota bacterium]|nr:hypothetical protein [Candidatus Eremiobacteraeota bacterium]
MRLFVSLASSVLAVSLLAMQPAAAHVRLAPADEYFGQQKMSILEVGNRLRDMSRQLQSPTAKTQDVLHTAQLTEDAMRDWQRKYPGDPWLRRDRIALERVYASARRLRR